MSLGSKAELVLGWRWQGRPWGPSVIALVLPPPPPSSLGRGRSWHWERGLGLQAADLGLGGALLPTVCVTFPGLSFLIGKMDIIFYPWIAGGANEIMVVGSCAQVEC